MIKILREMRKWYVWFQNQPPVGRFGRKLLLSGLVLISPLSGMSQSVVVTWDANTEPDLLGYKIYYGTASHSYSSVIDVGNVVEYQVQNLSSGMTYYFAVTAYDTAYNESGFSNEASITISSNSNPSQPPSPEPPQITDIIFINRRTIKVYFNQKMSKTSITNPDHYRIFPQLPIISLIPDPGLMFVEMTTATHDIQVDYTLTIQNLTKQSGIALAQAVTRAYRFADTAPPFVTGIHLVDLNTITISFSEKIEQASVEEKAHYSLTPSLNITGISLDETRTKAIIYTDSHSTSTTYVLTVQGVKDLRGNTMVNPFSITYSFSDHTPPRVVSVEVENTTTLHCYFSEKMDYASLSEKSHYQIQPFLPIYDVLVDTSLQKVSLRTQAHQKVVPYQLTISGLRNFSQIPMTHPFVYSYSFTSDVPPLPPAAPPSITDVVLSNRQTIRIYYNQQMDRISVLNRSNYTISPGIQIIAISLDPSLMFVVLTTTTHKMETDYTLTIQNVRNIADIPLTRPYNKTYRFHDTRPPFIAGIHLIDLTTLELNFNEKVAPSSALDANHYAISPALKIHQIQLDGTQTKVTLTTDPHLRSVNYMLSVQGVQDLKGNSMTNPFTISYSFNDQAPPEVVNVQTVDRTTISCFFSKKMDYGALANPAHYSIEPGIQIVDLVVDSSLQKATLRTTEHLAMVEYELTIADITDFHQIPMSEPFHYSYLFSDDIPPYVDKMELVSRSELKLYFSEKLNAKQWIGLENFQIIPPISIYSVEVDSSWKMIMLHTDTHQYEVKHALLIRDVYDQANNSIPSNYQIEYEFRRSAKVDSLSKRGYETAKIGIGDTYYIDRDFAITAIPEELQQLTWIKTSNNDKFSSGDEFLSFRIFDNVMVYVGYDERINVIPGWLQSWTRTEYRIQDDHNCKFRIFSKAFASPTVTLGGNYGRDQSNMYIVLVKSLTHLVEYPDPPIPIAGVVVKNFKLLQNYPNPFNPFTEIPFVAKKTGPGALIIYDLLGRVVRRFDLEISRPGLVKILWDSTSQEGLPVSSGLYLYRLCIAGYQETRKMILVR